MSPKCVEEAHSRGRQNWRSWETKVEVSKAMARPCWNLRIRRYWAMLFVPLIIALFLVEAIGADNESGPTPNISQLQQPRQEVAIRGTNDYGIPTSQLYELLFVIGIGSITLLLQCFLLLRTRAHPEEISRVTLITLIVTLAVGILVMGYSERQISPVLGLFGSIIGYLLGKADRSSTQRRT